MHMQNSDIQSPGSSKDGCKGECHTCPMGSQQTAAGGFSGWVLAIAAAATFLLPLAAALVGAAIGRSAGRQLLGAVAGIVIAIPVALVVNRWARRMTPDSPAEGSCSPEQTGKESS